MADGLVMDPLGESALPISTGKAAGLPMTPPASTTAEAPRGLLGLEKGTWNAIAIIANALADAGEGGKPPEARRQKGRNQQLMETRLLQQEQEEKKAEREERRALAMDAARMREAEHALKVAEFMATQDKRQFDAFDTIVAGLSKSIEAGVNPGVAMATASARAQAAKLDFMIPMFSGASEDTEFLKNLGPMSKLLKEDPRGAALLPRAAMMLRTPETARVFMKEMTDIAASGAVEMIQTRLYENPELRKKSFEELASVIAPDNRFVQKVFLGVVDMPEPIRKSLENSLTALGIKTPSVAAMEEEAGAKAKAAKMAETDPFIQKRVLAFEKEKAEAIEQIKAKYARDDRGQKTTQSVRSDFLGLPTTKVMQQAIGAYSQIEGILTGPHTTATDWALIVGYAKINDPDSVAREGEQAAVKNLASVDDRINNAYDLLLKKKILTPEIRKDIADAATRLVRGRLSSYESVEKEFKGIAGKEGGAETAVPDIVGADLRKRIKDGPTGKSEPVPEGLPDAKANAGRTVKDTKTGKRYKSDGTRWQESGG